MPGGHKGKIRTKLSAKGVQKLLRSIQKRIEDQSLTSAEFTSLTMTAAQLVETLHQLDKAHIARRKKEQQTDIFSKRGAGQP
jgi:hypothetical protein